MKKNEKKSITTWIETSKSLDRSFSSPLSGEYDWAYKNDNDRLARLYQLGKDNNWNADVDINWDKPLPLKSTSLPKNFKCEWSGLEDFEDMNDKDKLEFLREYHAWGINQTLHGEQGALLVSSQLVSPESSIIGKMYAASQAFDEARHVEVFQRYIQEREKIEYPITPPLKELIDKLLTAEEWDIKLLGMQLVIENIALANFNQLKRTVFDPVLQQIITYVIQDEARHVSYGIDQLKEKYEALPDSEKEKRVAIINYSHEKMLESLMPYAVWEKFGWDSDSAYAFFKKGSRTENFMNIFSGRVVPHMNRIGLIKK